MGACAVIFVPFWASCTEGPAPIRPGKEIPFLQPEEIPKFIKAVEGDIAEIPILLELQGLRRSEAKGLDWKDVDLGKGTIRIHSARVQNFGRGVRHEVHYEEPLLLPHHPHPDSATQSGTISL